MFGNFQKRVQNWFGMLKIDAGKLGGTQAYSALEITQDWNTSGNPTLIKANATTGIAGSSANLLDLQVAGTTKLSIDKDGTLHPRSIKGDTAGVCTVATLENGYGKISFKNVQSNRYWTVLDSNLLENCFSARAHPDTPCAVLRYDGFFGFIPGTSLPANITTDVDLRLYRDQGNTLAQRNETLEQEYRLYATYTSATAYQRLSTKSIREAVTVSGASSTTSISIPKYTHLIGVTTRVTTELTGASGYTVGDGTDADLWGDITGTAVGTTSDRTNFTAADALGPDGADRTITLTAKTSNFTGGVIEVCAFYLAAEAD